MIRRDWIRYAGMCTLGGYLSKERHQLACIAAAVIGQEVRQLDTIVYPLYEVEDPENRFQKVLESLEKNPPKIRFEHYRVPADYSVPDRGRPSLLNIERYYRGKSKWLPRQKGGATNCKIRLPGESSWRLGIAYCSHSDNFSYETGRKLAFERAVLAIRDAHLAKRGYPVFGVDMGAGDDRGAYALYDENGKRVEGFAQALLSVSTSELLERLNEVAGRVERLNRRLDQFESWRSEMQRVFGVR